MRSILTKNANNITLVSVDDLEKLETITKSIAQKTSWQNIADVSNALRKKYIEIFIEQNIDEPAKISAARMTWGVENDTDFEEILQKNSVK